MTATMNTTFMSLPSDDDLINGGGLIMPLLSTNSGGIIKKGKYENRDAVVQTVGGNAMEIYYLESKWQKRITSKPTVVTGDEGEWLLFAMLNNWDISAMFIPIDKEGNRDDSRDKKTVFIGSLTDDTAQVKVKPITVGDTVYFDKEIYTYGHLRSELFQLIEDKCGIDRLVGLVEDEYIYENGIEYFKGKLNIVEFYREVHRYQSNNGYGILPDSVRDIVDILGKVYAIHKLNLSTIDKEVVVYAVYNTAIYGDNSQLVAKEVDY